MCISFSYTSEHSQIYYQGLSKLVDILVTLHTITLVLKTMAASQRMIISNCHCPKTDWRTYCSAFHFRSSAHSGQIQSNCWVMMLNWWVSY